MLSKSVLYFKYRTLTNNAAIVIKAISNASIFSVQTKQIKLHISKSN